jgi:hypothetical protein
MYNGKCASDFAHTINSMIRCAYQNHIPSFKIFDWSQPWKNEISDNDNVSHLTIIWLDNWGLVTVFVELNCKQVVDGISDNIGADYELEVTLKYW